jgi:hypothetical protein
VQADGHRHGVSDLEFLFGRSSTNGDSIRGSLGEAEPAQTNKSTGRGSDRTLSVQPGVTLRYPTPKSPSNAISYRAGEDWMVKRRVLNSTDVGAPAGDIPSAAAEETSWGLQSACRQDCLSRGYFTRVESGRVRLRGFFLSVLIERV